VRCRIVQALCRGSRTDVYVPGNLLIQPNFACHDHTNNLNEPIIWIDALDSGLVKLFVDISVDSFPNTLSS
jgi:gentisate 1,2-dioxygenase